MGCEAAEKDDFQAVAPDAIHDEPCVRLGCLELYVQLADTATKTADAARFVTEEDQRQRVLVHWRNDSLEGTKSSASNSAGKFEAAEQTWRVSCAFAQNEPDDSLFETLGMEAVEWLWDGLSALVLAVGPQTEPTSAASSLFGRGVYASEQSIENNESQCWPRGLVGFCFEELCRRVDAEPDKERFCLGLSAWELLGNGAKDLLAAAGEDASSELRFETVQFRTASEAFQLMQAVARNNHAQASAQFSLNRHVFIRAVVIDCRRETMAALHFAQVAGGEACESIHADRKVLWDLLDSASTGDALEPKDCCQLAEVLGPLVAGNCKPFLLCSVPAQPRNSTVAMEAHELLDLAERASLITAQCTRVQGVRREVFQLAEFQKVISRLRTNGACSRSDDLQGLTELVNAKERFVAMTDAHTTSERDALQTRTHMPARLDGMFEEAVDVVSEISRVPPSMPASSYSMEKLAWAPGSPKRSTFLDEEFLAQADNMGEDLIATYATSTTPAASKDLGSHSSLAIKNNTLLPCQTNLGSLGARIAHAACMDECRELSAACATLRADNEAKAARRKKELQKVQAEVAVLREAIAVFENDCEAPELLNSFKKEIQALRSEAARLREQNAALAGARGVEARHNAQCVTLHALKAEVAKLRQSNAEVEQQEKHGSLVAHCLQEVRVRLDMSKRKLAEAEREFSALQPAYGELGRQIEHSERKRRWAQEELDKLRRASAGLRGEMERLREVRDCVDSLPFSAVPPSAGSNAADGATSAGGLERFAALQRRVAAAAPHLMPLCVRARSEMEELVRCCRHLEERQKRLQQVAPLADDTDYGAGLSCSSSVASGVTPRRARSSDAASWPGSQPSGRTRQLPLNLRAMMSEARRRPSSARSTPRSGTPRAVSPRRLDAVPSPARDVSPQPHPPIGHSPAVRSWVLDRDASRHGGPSRSQERNVDDRPRHRSPSRERGIGERGIGEFCAAGALREVGLPMPIGSPGRVHSVNLIPVGRPRSKSRDRYSKECSEPGRYAACQSARRRAK